MVNKIFRTLLTEMKIRGLYITFLMNVAHLAGGIRGMVFKFLYFKNIKSTLFSLQSNSRIEIFNKASKIHLGKFVFIRKNASIRVDFDGVLTIGDKVFINDNCNINCVKKISIGEYTKIGPNVCINDHDHNFKNISDTHLIKGEVVIGKNVWIGSNVVIVKNSVIGDNAVIAAGSVVKGHVPANTLYFDKRDQIIKPFFKQDKTRGIL